MNKLEFNLVCQLIVELVLIMEMGQGWVGVCCIIFIIGGYVKGLCLNGCILNFGVDW